MLLLKHSNIITVQLSPALYLFCISCRLVFIISIAAFNAYAVSLMMIHIESRRAAQNQQAQNNHLYSTTATQIAAGHVYLSEQRTEQGIIKFKHLPKHAKAKPEPHTEPALSLPEPQTLAEIKTTLLSDISDYQRLLIVGGQNSGKTTLLKHIAQQRRAADSVLILDSHNTAGKWARDYRIVGHGRDYSAIETELKNLVAVMDSHETRNWQQFAVFYA